MVKKEPLVSIIIPSFNTKKLLSDCLKSLFKTRKKNFEVIVVDNASKDGSPEMVAEKFKQVKLIKNKKNLGYGAANNQGIKKARGDYLLLLNSDTVVLNDAWAKMAAFLKKHPKAGVVGPKLLNKDLTSQPSAGRFPNLRVTLVMLFAERWFGGHLVRTSFGKIKETDWVMGAALMVKKEVVKKAGLMDEGIFMYMDEVEWCYRLKKAGWQVYFDPEPKIIHLGAGSSVSGREGPILNIYRGLLYFYQKHYSPWQLYILKGMLKLKAGLSFLLGVLTSKDYLKKTYGQAWQLV